MKQPTYNELFEATARWRSAGGDWPQFQGFVQMDLSRICYLIHEGQCDEVLSRKIQNLLGPHSYTIIKAYIATYS